MREQFTLLQQSRLVTKTQFQHVFQQRHRAFGKYYIVYYCENQQTYARVGVVASKRNVRKAVQRNRIRRIAKERFRLTQHALHGQDFVILAKKGADLAANEELHRCLKKLLSQLIVR